MSFRKKDRVNIKKSNFSNNPSAVLTKHRSIVKNSNLYKKEAKALGRHTHFPYYVKKSERTSLSASLTIEAALVLPLFLYLMIGVLGFVSFMGKTGAMEQALCKTAKEMAVFAYASENGDGKNSSLAGGISSGYAYAALQKEANGLKNFHLGYSTFMEKEEIDLVAAYRIQSKVPFFAFGSPQILQRACVRAWTGRDFRKEHAAGAGQAGKQTVYVTEHGSVYHKSLQCTHLKLSIQQILPSDAAAKRNRYGEKYYACSCCRSGTGSSVYITDTGNRYHADLSCSGLKRTIKETPVTETGHLRPCSKCGG